MKFTNPFRRHRPGHRKARRQVAALRAKTTAARRQLAETGALLAAGRPERKS